MQTCNICNQTKPLTEFYFRSDIGAHRKSCKDCFKAAKAVRESKPGVKDERARKERLRRLINKDTINATLREQRNAPALNCKVRANNAKSIRNRKLALADGITTEQLKEWKSLQIPICVYCGAIYDLGIDHIVPLSKDGTHTVDNLCICCKSCNSSKYTNSILYWFATKRQLVEATDKKL